MISPRKRRKNEHSISHQSIVYFNAIGETHFYECKTCGSKINGQKEYNLASHLRHIHPEIYNGIAGREKESIQVKRLKLLQNFVEIVAVNGRPFTYILDSGFQSIAEKKQRKLNAAGIGLNLKKRLWTKFIWCFRSVYSKWKIESSFHRNDRIAQISYGCTFGGYYLHTS